MLLGMPEGENMGFFGHSVETPQFCLIDISKNTTKGKKNGNHIVYNSKWICRVDQLSQQSNF